jgi:nicotinate-nucleotide pyrophosphorylase
MAELEQVIKNAKGIAKIVMLDNFNKSHLSEAINILRENKIKIELSGGINLKNFDKLQQKGINYYSIGMLTHSYKSMDFSLEF